MYLFQNDVFVKTTFIYLMGLLFPNATFIYFFKLLHSTFISTYITTEHLLPLHIYYPSTFITTPHLLPLCHAVKWGWTQMQGSQQALLNEGFNTETETQTGEHAATKGNAKTKT